MKSRILKNLVGSIQVAQDTLLVYSQDTVDFILTDRFQRAFESLQIINRQGQQQSLIRYPEQETLWQFILECREKNMPVRAIILKARQLGFSTFILGLFTLIVVLRPNIAAFTASFEDKSATWLFRKVHFYYDKMPRDLKTGKRFKARDKRQIIFDLPHYSSFTSATAKGNFLASSLTIQLLHLSEIAKWPASSTLDTYTSIMQTTDFNNPDSMIFIESTAYGVNLFKDLWDEARAGENDFKPFFFTWVGFPEYYFYFNDSNKPKFSEQAIQLQKESKINDYQLAWAQKTCRDKCANNWDMFHQENPWCEQVAFRYTGSPWFSAPGIQELHKHVMDPLYRGIIKWGDRKKPIVVFGETADGHIEIWQHPRRGRQYVWSADVCAGIGGDYFVLNVFMVPEKITESLEQVAKVRSNRIGSRLAAQVCFQVAVYYNWAFGACEVNNMGIDTAHTLEHGEKGTPTEGGYPALYYYTRIDQVTQEETRSIGWNTTLKTKTFMLENLQTVVDEHDIVLRSKRTVLELEGFCHDPEKRDWVSMHKDEFTKRRHDDEVMSAAIGYQMYLNRPKTAAFRELGSKYDKR